MGRSEELERISEKFNEATLNAFELLNQSMGVRTFFVGETTEDTFSILKVFNNNGSLIEEDQSIPLKESYCNLIYSGERKPLMIEGSTEHSIVSKLPITKIANIGSYLGVPIILEDNTMFGTLCAVDPSAYKFNSADVDLMKTLANFIGNAIDLGRAYEKILAEEQRVKKELTIAKKVQTSVLSEPLDLEDISINAYYQSSESLSGDMYSWFQISPSKYGVILLDVMGHGVSASLISMSIRSVLRGLITTIIDPVKVISELSHHIYQLFNSNQHSTYATAIYIVIDTDGRTLEYVNAGHPSGLLLVNNSSVKRLDEGCLPLGIYPEFPIESEKISWEENPTVLLYTDGLTELINPAINESILALEAILLDYPNKLMLINEIYRKYVKEKTLTDDVCFVSVTVK